MTDVVLVDTDVFSYLWQGRPEGKAFEHLVVGKIAALSFTTVGELWYGALLRNWGDQKKRLLESAVSAYLILPFAPEMPRTWGEVMAGAATKGKEISPNDAWIAVTAIHYDVPLITNNRRHFEHVDRLQLLP